MYKVCNRYKEHSLYVCFCCSDYFTALSFDKLSNLLDELIDPSCEPSITTTANPFCTYYLHFITKIMKQLDGMLQSNNAYSVQVGGVIN